MTKTARILIWTLSIAWILWMVPLFCSSATTAEKQYSVTIHIQKTGTLAEALKMAEKYSKDGAEVTIQPVKCFGGQQWYWQGQNMIECVDSVSFQYGPIYRGIIEAIDSSYVNIGIGGGFPNIKFNLQDTTLFIQDRREVRKSSDGDSLIIHHYSPKPMR